MGNKRGAVGRRKFLKSAAAGAAAMVTKPETGQAQQVAAQDHDHDHQVIPSDLTLRVKALESLLVEKGLVDPLALDALIDTYENKVGPRNGAQVVARARVDPAYKKLLLTDAAAAIAKLGYKSGQGEHIRVRENSPKTHN